MFKPQKIYLQVFRNKIVAIDLVTGKRVIEQAIEPFSSIRQTIGNFKNANATLKNALKNLGIKKSFLATKAVIQQMEGIEGGLSDIEKRALLDMAELSDIYKVYIVEQDKVLSLQEALSIIDAKK